MRLKDIIYTIIREYTEYEADPTKDDIQNILFILSTQTNNLRLEFLKYASGPYNKRVDEAIENGSMDHAYHTDGGTVQLCNCPVHSYQTNNISDDTVKLVKEIINKYNKNNERFIETLKNNKEYNSTAKYEPIRISKIDL